MSQSDRSEGSVFRETVQMFQEIWPKLKDDIDVTEEELKDEGYKVLMLIPNQVGISHIEGRLGFAVALSNEKIKEVTKLLATGLKYNLHLWHGLHKQLAVFLVTLKNENAKRALVYPVYYHTSSEWLLEEQGKGGLFTFFKTQSGNIAAWVALGSSKPFLYSRYKGSS